MGLFDRFKSPQFQIAKLAAGVVGAQEFGNDYFKTEVAEWVDNLPPDDPRRNGVPRKFFEGDYYTLSQGRELGSVIRVTPKALEVRLPMEIRFRSGVSAHTSHLHRRIPLKMLMALEKKRAIRAISRAVEEANTTFQKHHRMCEECKELKPPASYPGHPNRGVLGDPAKRVIPCTKTCDIYKEKMAKREEEIRKQREEQREAYEKEQEELRKLNKGIQ